MAMRLSLGPVPGYWPEERLYEFYAEAMTWPLADVYIGETVCSKRRSLNINGWLDLARDIAAAGMRPILSTLALIEARSELATVRRLCRNGKYLVEANDHGAARLLHELGVPWVAGAAMNLYNAVAIRWAARRGMIRWQVPTDMAPDAVAYLHHELGKEMPEIEIHAWGLRPLAWSARCFAARAYNRQKDDCGFVCADHPDGIDVVTQDGKPFLNINGVQTRTVEPVDLSSTVHDLDAIGVSVLRISPATSGTDAAVSRLAAATIPGHSVDAAPAPCHP